MSDIASVIYGKTIVTGDYYIAPTDITEIQPVYVHNHNWFIDSLSISLGPIGVGISIDDFADVM